MKVDAPPSADRRRCGRSSTPTTRASKSYRFLNHDDAYNEFKKIFADQPALVESTTPDALPESFRVVPIDGRADRSRSPTSTQDAPGVDTSSPPQEQIKRLLTAPAGSGSSSSRWRSVLLASSLFLIVNTIRLATFARRREIEVMKLVGASNWFVRVPFMAEGFVQGAIGAGFAFGFVFA